MNRGDDDNDDDDVSTASTEILDENPANYIDDEPSTPEDESQRPNIPFIFTSQPYGADWRPRVTAEVNNSVALQRANELDAARRGVNIVEEETPEEIIERLTKKKRKLEGGKSKKMKKAGKSKKTKKTGKSKKTKKTKAGKSKKTKKTKAGKSKKAKK
jgi:hypothetical protein